MSGDRDAVAEVLAAHEPVLGMFAGRAMIVGCSCLSARDYRAAEFRAGQDGWRAHLADALAGVIAAKQAEVVEAVEVELDDADQGADTLRKPNRIAVWGVRRVLMRFGGKPHRWPVPNEFCDECEHHTYSHDEECLHPDCDCLLSESEAGFGRDESLDNTITAALWEDAVANGEEWATEEAER